MAFLLEGLAGLLLCVGTALALRGGLVRAQGIGIAGLDGKGIGLAVLSVAAAVFFFGPMLGLALVLSVALHEFGHVAAFRAAGHRDARFRLIPLLGGVAISNRRPETEAHDVFITLMGPAIGIGPMVLAYALAGPAGMIAPLLGQFLLVFATVTGALNFLNLLPFLPLDGGRILRSLAGAVWPPAALVVTGAGAAILVLLALVTGSPFLFLLAVMGVSSAIASARDEHILPPLSKGQAVLAAAAYGATAGALYLGGAEFLRAFV